MNSIFNRTSVRNYLDKVVEDEKIEKILRAAMAAPSTGNQQPWEFIVVKNKAILEKLALSSSYSKCAKDAPFAIIPCHRKNGLKYEMYLDMDMSAACENILLEAVELGLGAVWIGVAPLQDRVEEVARILNISENLVPFAIIPCGYPANEVNHKDRFDKSRIHYIQ